MRTVLNAFKNTLIVAVAALVCVAVLLVTAAIGIMVKELLSGFLPGILAIAIGCLCGTFVMLLALEVVNGLD